MIIKVIIKFVNKHSRYNIVHQQNIHWINDLLRIHGVKMPFLLSHAQENKKGFLPKPSNGPRS